MLQIDNYSHLGPVSNPLLFLVWTRLLITYTGSSFWEIKNVLNFLICRYKLMPSLTSPAISWVSNSLFPITTYYQYFSYYNQYFQACYHGVTIYFQLLGLPTPTSLFLFLFERRFLSWS